MNGTNPLQIPNTPARDEERIGGLQLLWAQLDYPLRMFLMNKGYILPPQIPSQSFAASIINLDRMRNILEAMKAAPNDAEKLSILANNILGLLGVDTSKLSIDDEIKIISKNFTAFAPFVLQFIGEDVYDQLFGHLGSQALLAKGILSAYYDFGISGQDALSLSDRLQKELAKDPNLTKGFSTSEIETLLKQSVKLGLVAPTIDPSSFIYQVKGLLGVASAIRDSLGKKGIEVDINKLPIALYETLTKKYPGLSPALAAERIRRDLYISERAPYGLYQYGVQRSGVVSLVPPERYTQDDTLLRAKAVDSPVGNMVGATIRMVEEMNVEGPIRKLYDSIKAGELPRISLTEWALLAARSGVPTGDAFVMLRQRSRNKAYLMRDSKVIQTLRSAQFKYDIAPLINRINMMYVNPEVRRGQIAEIARRLGYKDIGILDAGQVMAFLHSPIINRQIREGLEQAARVTQQEEEMASIRRPGGVIRRLADVFVDREKPVTLGRIALETLGALPVKQTYFKITPTYEANRLPDLRNYQGVDLTNKYYTDQAYNWIYK